MLGINEFCKLGDRLRVVLKVNYHIKWKLSDIKYSLYAGNSEYIPTVLNVDHINAKRKHMNKQTKNKSFNQHMINVVYKLADYKMLSVWFITVSDHLRILPVMYFLFFKSLPRGFFCPVS